VPTRRLRLDLLLVERQLAMSRQRARALIMAGQVRVNGRPITKAGTSVPGDAEITLIAPDHPYVSRGGLKLAHALETFAIDVHDRIALDIGASTGGFTDALLQHGARQVIALDVGYGQLDWRLRTDPRVVVLEHVNARFLKPSDLPGKADVVTIDVSFISLKHILPVVPPIVAPRADVVVLVKPQFEAGRDDVGEGGLVLDPAVHERVVDGIRAAARAVGLKPVAMTPSPITGATGNQEFLLQLRSAS